MKIRFIAGVVASALMGTLLSPAFAVGSGPAQANESSVRPSAKGSSVAKLKRRAKPNLKWRVPQGSLFNNPMVEADRYIIERHLLKAIRNTPKRGHITISAYSLDRGAVARELIAARQRGVRVQILLNDHLVPRAQTDIQRVIGHNTNKRNFLKRCYAGCRADANIYNNLHSKFYLFSQTGRKKHVVMFGSANLTMNAVRWQWNDLYTVAERPVLYQQFRKLFNDMRPDWNVRRATYEFCDDANQNCKPRDQAPFLVTVFPRFSTKKDDAILDILNKVQCQYVDEAGAQQSTVLRLSMHTMRGVRGNYLADKLRQLYAEGCDLRVNYGLMGFVTKQHIGAPTARGRVPLRSTGFDLNLDPLTIERYTHHKYFALRGSYAGDVTANRVWTGSTNWASLGTPQDEILVSLKGRKLVNRYFANFETMWHPPYSRDAYTTTYSSWRSINGRSVGQDPVVTVEPDGVRGGTTWEND